MTVVLIAIACGVAAVLYGILTSMQVLKASAGNERMVAVAAAIQEGAKAYLFRQYSTIGDSGAGLRGLSEVLVERYRNPRPRLEAGQRLAPLIGAMMDVSDGLLIDASRLAAASGVAAEIDIALVPMSQALLAALGDGREARLEAATAGDDYELLFAARPERARDILALQDELGLAMSRIGGFAEGSGLRLTEAGAGVPLPSRLGWEHR